ncbi:TetR/AcrR family transcriptional regulator [Actinocrispum wychmicini]|uniref:TetR family transcriptional regulator n=1 Tax=Actinocrispum wychmicini TaxID=1213861 RepID=A0A4R2IUW3_9PSEU|nr:TetR family transcriptional regulator [Actinocrispum wychmicini]TCO48897.1 TetR family transcriptional regulator [Actinocrispum wychmicini]
MGLREIKMERTRQLIADKAFELFTEQGFDNTTIEQIAAAAEVGPRTLYRYFPTKEALIVTFVEAYLFTALDQLRAQPDDTPLPEALYALVDNIVAATAANSDRMLAVHELAERTASVRAQLTDLWWTWRAEVAAEVARRHRGRSADMAGGMAAAVVMLVIDLGVEVWAQSGGRTNLRRVVNRCLEMLRSGEVPIASPTSSSA